MIEESQFCTMLFYETESVVNLLLYLTLWYTSFLFDLIYENMYNSIYQFTKTSWTEEI